MSHPALTAVVLTYNGRQLLDVILPSLAAQHYGDFTTIVVDNGSEDDSRRYLAECWPEVEVIAIEENIGVAAALNRGVRAARGEFVALLNNDLELASDWLDEMVAGMIRHPDAAVAACKLRNYYERERIDAAGDLFTRDGRASRRGHGELDRGQYDGEEEIFAATAGAGLYRATVLAEVGPFDESFFAYFEDVDWGIRAQLTGHSTIYVPSAVGYHMGGQTTRGEQDAFYYTLHKRNLIALIVKDMPLSLILRNSHRLLRTQLGGLYDSARSRMLTVHLRALCQAVMMAPTWLRSRRQIQRSRRVSPARLSELMEKT